MYNREDRNQISIEEFFLPFGGRLRKGNRWVRLAGLLPWERIEEIYVANLNEETGRPALSARIVFGAIFIHEYDHLTDERTVESIQENLYMQCFLGLHEFHSESLFDPSIMVHFRKRLPVEEVAKINEFLCTGKWSEAQRNVDRNDDNGHEPPVPPSDAAEVSSRPSKQSGKPNRNTSEKKKQQKKRKKNCGKLLLDATVAPADIKYPTNVGLLNKSREHLETVVDILWEAVSHRGHKLPYSARKARKSYPTSWILLFFQ